MRNFGADFKEGGAEYEDEYEHEHGKRRDKPV